MHTRNVRYCFFIFLLHVLEFYSIIHDFIYFSNLLFDNFSFYDILWYGKIKFLAPDWRLV